MMKCNDILDILSGITHVVFRRPYITFKTIVKNNLKWTKILLHIWWIKFFCLILN